MSECGTLAAYFRHRRRKEVTCPECRAAMVTHVAQYRKPNAVCECGKPMGSQATMCRWCQASLAARAQAAAVRAERASRAAIVLVDRATLTPLPSRHPVMRLISNPPRRPVRPFFAGPCAWCETHFTLRDQPGRFCSDRCQKASARARRGRFKVPPRIRLAIYERDRWTCQLCSEPVDPALSSSDEWGATLDHVECQSWTLIPDHSPNNLRLAHRWCNSVRGNETYYTAADLAA